MMLDKTCVTGSCRLSAFRQVWTLWKTAENAVSHSAHTHHWLRGMKITNGSQPA